MFTFGLRDGYEAVVQLVSKVKLFSHVPNLDDTRRLIIHPASTTHRQVEVGAQRLAGAGVDFIRLSISLENVDDIIADLKHALG